MWGSVSLVLDSANIFLGVLGNQAAPSFTAFCLINTSFA